MSRGFLAEVVQSNNRSEATENSNLGVWFDREQNHALPLFVILPRLPFITTTCHSRLPKPTVAALSLRGPSLSRMYVTVCPPAGLARVSQGRPLLFPGSSLQGPACMRQVLYEGMLIMPGLASVRV